MKLIQSLLIAAAILFASISQAATYGTLSANGDTAIITVKGPFLFKATGTWGGGTLAVYFLSANGTYRAFNVATAHTSDATGELLYDLPPNAVAKVKATLSGSTSPTLLWEFVGSAE